MEWLYSKKTTNTSFIEMWRYLQRKKIENNIFMLRTLHEELVDFNLEYYMSLDRDSFEYGMIKKLIIDEAKKNIWFYFRELVYVPILDSLDYTVLGYQQFKLTPLTMRMIYLYENDALGTITSSDDPVVRITLGLLYLYHKEFLHSDMLFTCNYQDDVVDILKKLDRGLFSSPYNIVFGSGGCVESTRKYPHVNEIPPLSYREYLTFWNMVKDLIAMIKQEMPSWNEKDIGIFMMDNDDTNAFLLINLIKTVMGRKYWLESMPSLPRLKLHAEINIPSAKTNYMKYDHLIIWYESVLNFIPRAYDNIYDVEKPLLYDNIYLMER